MTVSCPRRTAVPWVLLCALLLPAVGMPISRVICREGTAARLEPADPLGRCICLSTSHSAVGGCRESRAFGMGASWLEEFETARGCVDIAIAGGWNVCRTSLPAQATHFIRLLSADADSRLLAAAASAAAPGPAPPSAYRPPPLQPSIRRC